MQEIMLVNPAKRKTRRKTTTKRKASSRRRSPAKRRASSRRRSPAKRRTYRKNPAPRTIARRVIDRQLMPAAVQAAGALGVDYAYGFAGQYLPDNLTTGMMRHVTKGAGAVLLSTLAANFTKAATANELAKGSLTVIMYEAGKEAMENAGMTMGYYSSSPVVRRRGMGYYQRPSGRRLPSSTTSPNRPGMGYYLRAPGAGGGGMGVNELPASPDDVFNSADIG